MLTETRGSASDVLHDDATASPPRYLKACLAAGNALSLFAVLSQWNRTQIEGLLCEIDEMDAAATKAIADWYAQEWTKPEVFFSKRQSAELDACRDRMEFDLMCVLAEISSVAQYFLPRCGARDAAE